MRNVFDDLARNVQAWRSANARVVTSRDTKLRHKATHNSAIIMRRRTPSIAVHAALRYQKTQRLDVLVFNSRYRNLNTLRTGDADLRF